MVWQVYARKMGMQLGDRKERTNVWYYIDMDDVDEEDTVPTRALHNVAFDYDDDGIPIFVGYEQAMKGPRFPREFVLSHYEYLDYVDAEPKLARS